MIGAWIPLFAGGPTAPILSQVPNDFSAVLQWDVVSSADSYNLYYGFSSGVTKLNGTLITGVTSPFIYYNATNGVNYYFAVSSVANGSESDLSNEVNIFLGKNSPFPSFRWT